MHTDAEQFFQDFVYYLNDPHFCEDTVDFFAIALYVHLVHESQSGIFDLDNLDQLKEWLYEEYVTQVFPGLLQEIPE